MLSSSRGQANFRGLEAKAKDLTFEAKAKAKDFKMCPRGRPRGQGRPRGLHLCHTVYESFFSIKSSRGSRFLLHDDVTVYLVIGLSNNTITAYNCNSRRILQQGKQSRIFLLNVKLFKRNLQDS